MISHSPNTTGMDERETGTGGKPPVIHRPTGGGGGGGDDDWSNGYNPSARLDRARMTLAIILSTDVLAIIIVMAATLGHLSQNAGDSVSGSDRLTALPPLLFLNAALLLLSCLAVERARQHIFQEIDALEEWLGLGKPALRRSLPWLGVTMTLGGCFLGTQLLIHHQMVGFTAGWRGRLAEIFPLAAGIHAVHLSIGVTALAFCLIGARMLRRMELRQILIDSVAWFWHTMSMVWMMLLVMLVFG